MKLFDLYADLSLNSSKFNEGIRSAGEAGASFQDKTSKVTATAVALGHALYDVGVKAFETAKDLGDAIIEGYSETEQLLGGVETMFEDHSGIVIANATAAYRKAGMSANDYMETVTGFSASLLQGLGGDTEKAANVADMAILDMSDNANKFGTNIGMIQNAYQGFAKDNFTMLDNLKLGYGGTAAEMARLVNESGVLGESIQCASFVFVRQVAVQRRNEVIHTHGTIANNRPRLDFNLLRDQVEADNPTTSAHRTHESFPRQALFGLLDITTCKQACGRMRKEHHRMRILP